MALTYRIEIQPVSPGLSEEGDAITYYQSITDIVQSNPEVPTKTVVRCSAAQIQGIMRYIGIIRFGANTAAVETAIAGALP